MKIKNYFEKNAFPIIVSTIVFGILLLTVGFSAFRQQLFITGMFADVRVPADIRVTGISPNGNKNDGVSNSEDYNVKNISGNITLPNSDSSITYRVEVTNFEGPEMGIFDLTGLPDNLEYTLEEYELKEKICENDRCTLGVKKSFNITIQYKENGYDSENQTFNFKLDFDFRSYHKVRYEGLTYSDTYPQEVMDRDTLEFDFNNNEKITNLKVTVDEVNNTSFTLEGQKFTLENVTGDVVIQTATTKTTAFIEFMKEQTTKDDRDFDFHNPDAIENGVFLHYETIDDEYPIYYYRGDVENHLIYANHCWQIVRTSEQGGLKIVYDGKTSGGQCNDSRDRLGSEPYNEKPNNLASPSQVGYMYGEIENILTISPSRLDDLMQKDSLQDITNIIKEKMTTETTIIAGASVSWNGTTYEIQSYKTYTDDTPRMLFKNAIEDNGDNNRYTCLSNSTTCDTVYYFQRRNSETVYGAILTEGNTFETTIDGNKMKTGTVFGHDVLWDGKQYTLQSTITVTDLDDLEDDIRGGPDGSFPNQTPNAFHYTCLTKNDTCAEVYYIYYNDYGNYYDSWATGLFGIKLEDGRNITQTLDALLSKSTNTTSSYAKAYIDEWFLGEGSDFISGEPLINHITELEDALWCNDRTIAGYHGWDIDADNHASDNKYLHFDAFKRLVGEGDLLPTRPRLKCDSKNDTFTVENPKGNQDLTYPIALLDADEAVLAGAIYGEKTDTYLASGNEMFLMSPYYISDDHVRMFTVKSDGSLDNDYSANNHGIRPAIVLKNTMAISGGSGTRSDPYQVDLAS